MVGMAAFSLLYHKLQKKKCGAQSHNNHIILMQFLT